MPLPVPYSAATCATFPASRRITLLSLMINQQEGERKKEKKKKESDSVREPQRGSIQLSSDVVALCLAAAVPQRPQHAQQSPAGEPLQACCGCRR